MLNVVRKVVDLFETAERWELARIFALTLVMALVQTAGVASILPFMSLVSNPEIITENPVSSWFYTNLGFESTRSFLLAAGLGVLVITASSNGMTAFHHYLLVRFLWRKQYRISVRLLRKYLFQPYIFHLDRNSSTLAKNILAEVSEVINGVVIPGMKMFANVLVVVCIFGMLLVVDLVLALVSVTVLGGIYGVVYVIVRRKQGRLGRIRRDANGLRFKAANEALGAVKETQVMNREAEFLERFSRPARRFATVTAHNSVISDIPRYAIETIAFGGIILVMLYILNTQQDFGRAMAIVSLYALAGYRLMPALQVIFHGVARIRFYSATLDHLHEDLVGTVPLTSAPLSAVGPKPERLRFSEEIRLNGVSFRYPSRAEWVVNGIDLRIRRNTTIGLVGSTGSGKTTLVDMILGLLDAERGELQVDGVAIDASNVGAWRQNLGYVPQHIFLSDDTISSNIAFGVPETEIDPRAVERAARIAHLHDFIESLPDGYDTIIGERGVRLSGGQRQRIGIARALYRDPSVLIMDEATSALDGITEDVVMEAIDKLAHKKTIILVAHRISTLKDCDVIYLLENGRIVASGSYRDLLLTNQEFRAMAKLSVGAVAS